MTLHQTLGTIRSPLASTPQGGFRFPVSALLSALTVALVALVGCSESSTAPPGERSFLDGTADDPQIGLVLESVGRALRLFQLGDPEETRTLALGTSSAVTPTEIGQGDGVLAIPLGNAASVALVDPEEVVIRRFFLFPEGNATGVAFVDANTFLVANMDTHVVGRVELDQAGDEISETVEVAPRPTAIVMAGGRAVVVSANLDEDWAPIGDGVATILDPVTLEIQAVVETGDRNPTSAAVGPDGLVYVVNTGDFVGDGSVAVIDPVAGTLVEVLPGFGAGPGSIHVDGGGRVFVSGFFLGTVVWDTGSGSFLRPPSDPVCAPLAAGGCRGASAARTDASGRLFQVFFGSPPEDLPAQVFIYEGSGYALADSVPAGQGPTDLLISVF